MDRQTLYARARARGLAPADAYDEADNADSSDDSGPDSVPNLPPSVLDGPMLGPATPPTFTGAEDTKALGPGPAQPPPLPPPPPALTDRLSEALARARARPPLPADINDDALQRSMEGDERRAAGDKFTEALRAAFARQAPNFSGIRSGPSAATQGLLSKRQSFQQGTAADRSEALKEAAILKGADKPAESQSLIDWRKAQADRLNGLETRDAASAEATRAKTGAAQTAADAEKASLENERAVLMKDPRAKAFGLTPEYLANLDRKGLEGVRRQIETSKPPKGPGPAAVKAGDYSTVPPEMRETVKAIVEGRAPPPPPGSRFGAQLMNYVTAIDPSFDSSKFSAYQGVRTKLAESPEVVAFNTARQHIIRARSNIPKNFDMQALNRIRQGVLTGSGSALQTPFETDVKIAADELAKAYGNNAESGRQEVAHILSSVQSPQQLEAALNEIDHLLEGKLSAYQHQFESAAPKGASMSIAAPVERPQPAAPQAPDGMPPGAVQKGDAWYYPTDAGWVRWRPGAK